VLVVDASVDAPLVADAGPDGDLCRAAVRGQITLYPTTPLVRRCWALRANVTSYDACYVALAEALDVALLTSDAKLAKAPGTRCRFQLV